MHRVPCIISCAGVSSDVTFLETTPIETGFWSVRACSVPARWAIRDLGLTETEVGKYLGLSKPAVSRAPTRGKKLIVDQFLPLKD